MSWRTEVTWSVLEEVATERDNQQVKWGEQNHPNGTGCPGDARMAEVAKLAVDTAAEAGELTWRAILGEELFEAYAESTPATLRVELVQIAAVAVAWVEAIDRATGATPAEHPALPHPALDLK